MTTTQEYAVHAIYGKKTLLIIEQRNTFSARNAVAQRIFHAVRADFAEGVKRF